MMDKCKGLLGVFLLSGILLLPGCKAKIEERDAQIERNAVIYMGNRPIFYIDEGKGKTNYLLNNNEFIIPDNVFETYTLLVDNDIKKYGKNEIYGGLITKNLLLEDSKKEHFVNSLISSGYSPEWIIEFYKVLITRGNIIFKEKALQDSSFEESIIFLDSSIFSLESANTCPLCSSVILL